MRIWRWSWWRWRRWSWRRWRSWRSGQSEEGGLVLEAPQYPTPPEQPSPWDNWISQLEFRQSMFSITLALFAPQVSRCHLQNKWYNLIISIFFPIIRLLFNSFTWPLNEKKDTTSYTKAYLLPGTSYLVHLEGTRRKDVATRRITIAAPPGSTFWWYRCTLYIIQCTWWFYKGGALRIDT